MISGYSFGHVWQLALDIERCAVLIPVVERTGPVCLPQAYWQQPGVDVYPKHHSIHDDCEEI
jgi:hypothetical protein